jgi:hypothetical protein
MNSITDENTNTLNTRKNSNMMISTNDSMSLSQAQRQHHKVHCRTTRSRSPTTAAAIFSKTVSFGSAFTREYSVTVGDHHRSTDSAGLTLDWGFAAEYAVPVEQEDHFVSSSRRRIRRMSVSERRKRICSVTGCLPSDVRAAEYNMALQRYNQELTRRLHDTMEAEQAEVDPQDATNESRRLLHHQQHLIVLYASFQDVQYQQEQECNHHVHRRRHVHRHRQHQGHQQQ